MDPYMYRVVIDVSFLYCNGEYQRICNNNIERSIHSVLRFIQLVDTEFSQLSTLNCHLVTI